MFKLFTHFVMKEIKARDYGKWLVQVYPVS